MELHHINPSFFVINRKIHFEKTYQRMNIFNFITFQKGSRTFKSEFDFNRRLGITPYPEETDHKSIKTIG